MFAVNRVIAKFPAQIVIAHRRALRCGPSRLTNAVLVNRYGQAELDFRTTMAQNQCPIHRGSKIKSSGRWAPDDVFHIHAVPGAQQRTVENAVDDFGAFRPTKGQVKIIGLNAFAPLRHGERIIIAVPR